jgi:uncharacterized protein YbjT (DUF2867 family)
MKDKRTALVLGATGLVGGELMRLLNNDDAYTMITLPVRRNSDVSGEKVQQHIIDFDRMEEQSHLFKVDDVFCCLGATMKKAGSREAFKKVDYHYVVQAADLAKGAGASQFLVISAMMANPRSSVFYNRVKGEVEEKLQTMGFEALHIFRPSLLLGERNEQRFAEELGMKILPWLSFLMVGPARKYRPVEAQKVAMAMKTAALEKSQGIHIWESDSLREKSESI